jgi:CRP-like cAMP-binding protein
VAVLGDFSQAGQAEPTACMQYTPGSYFGEIALLYKERRRANVVADGACTVGAIDRGAFKRLLGPLADILEDGMLQYSTISDDVHVPSTPPQHTPRTEQVAVESVNDTR